MEQKKIEISAELKEIILQRILTSKLPSNIKLSVGNLSKDPMSIQEIVQHVKDGDEIGEKIMQMEMAYLQALKEGIISKMQNG